MVRLIHRIKLARLEAVNANTLKMSDAQHTGTSDNVKVLDVMGTVEAASLFMHEARLEILAHLYADLLCECKRGRRRYTADQQAACNGQVE